ncbi:beta strand repeat-containing protein [Haemophilus influenzae]|uniref:beta strand repeat-containing protein n=1 Tax=Haemophilus influenzae TaxID=727 RepID=UPI002868909B|nr:adhesin [Haemophilus influenzae]
MITGDKVTLKTGAVIDLSGKEGGETYLGGDERGEGKNGIQLAKKTTLEKGSTINVSGKEKGGRAIVWGDIALIDGNINAQGKDIAKTGGFVETSGHDLFINDDAIIDAKEWLLDPENVSIDAPAPGRTESTPENEEYITEDSSNQIKYKNKQTLRTLTNTTLEKILKRSTSVNITATKIIRVNSDINIGSGSHLTLWSEGQGGSGVDIIKNITSAGGNLTVHSGGWIDVRSNISITDGGNINFKAGKDIAFEKGVNQVITGQGVITSGNEKGFRFENVTLNGTGNGLLFNLSRPQKNNSAVTNFFNGTLNISGTVNISLVPTNTSTNRNWFSKYKGRTHWNLTYLNVSNNGKFSLTIDSTKNDYAAPLQSTYDLNGISFTKDTAFNVNRGAEVNFDIKAPIGIQGTHYNLNYALFNGNISVSGGGNVTFKLNASSSNAQTPGVIINSKYFNASGGSSLEFKTEGSTKVGFLINNDLTLNATGGNISLLQIEGIDGEIGKGVEAKKNITFEGGNITFGSKKAITEINGGVTINKNANVTLIGSDFDNHQKPLTIKKDVIINSGNLTAGGNVINIDGNLTVNNGANLKAITNFTFNVSGLFDNKGNSSISITKGGVQFKDINNTGELNITTNSSSAYHTIIKGNITNEKGDLNITNNGNNTEIQIGGNISQKEGNLTISSDKVNITNQITIKAGVNGEGSSSSATNNANLTIKTKELKLVNDLNISGFNKAEITAKDNSDLIIGNSNSDSGDANAKKVTFDKVKESKISADGHNVTLNSKVKTSNDDNSTGDDGDNNTGLAINAKNVTVNKDITSHKTVNITASENVTTKAGTTINTSTGSVEVTAKTGDIKGGIESKSGNVNITANGETLAVGNISGNTVTITADSGKLTTQADSTITGTESVTTSSQSGDISGTISGDTVSVSTSGGLTTQSNSKIEAKTGEANVTGATSTIGGTVSGKTVNVTASSGGLTVGGGARIKATEGAATLNAIGNTLTTQSGSDITSLSGQASLSAHNGDIAGNINAANVTLNITGNLTTATGSNIKATSGTLVINAKDAELNGEASGNHTVVNATNANGSGSVIATTSSRVSITGDLITINGLNIISKNGKNTVLLKGVEIDVKYIQPGIASVYEVIEAKRALEKVKDLSDEEREALAKLGVSAVRFIEPNNTITVDTQNEFATRPLSRIVISEGRACFSNSDGATVCVNIADNGR